MTNRIVYNLGTTKNVLKLLKKFRMYMIMLYL